MHVLLLRCWWEKKSSHTIFIYIFTSMADNIPFWKTIYFYYVNIGSKIFGGYPLEIKDIKNNTKNTGYLSFSL